jgi:hypothetical protein
VVYARLNLEDAVLTALLASKVATAVIASGIVVGGTTAAAYAGALPSGMQELAHQTIGAQPPDAQDEDQQDGDAQGDDQQADPTDNPTDTPTDTPTDSPTATPTDVPTDAPTGEPAGGRGPDATGPAAFGLCNAWTHGGLSANSVAYASLLTAAGGAADGIAAYCATIPHPGGAKLPSDEQGGQPAGHGNRTAHGHHGGSAERHSGSHGHGHGHG